IDDLIRKNEREIAEPHRLSPEIASILLKYGEGTDLSGRGLSVVAIHDIMMNIAEGYSMMPPPS
ncbi:MAG: hypothetical protein KGI75_15020, partial [Rhizobiaceae bacterium]|nr:hypothetical protein [Rhizobiaceae bacterium]